MYKDYCQVTKSGEFSNFLMAWEILDWYKKAVLLTRELEVEMEAIALSRIGRVYDKVLKMKSKAKENFKRSIELALTMLPRTFNNEGECYFLLDNFKINVMTAGFGPSVLKGHPYLSTQQLKKHSLVQTLVCMVNKEKSSARRVTCFPFVKADHSTIVLRIRSENLF